MKQSIATWAIQRLRSIDKQNQSRRRRQCGRPRQELAQTNEIGIGVFIDPFPAQDELIPEITDMDYWTAETGQTKLEKR
jgi:hypothetical protein